MAGILSSECMEDSPTEGKINRVAEKQLIEKKEVVSF
jgi:hypothetical protein